MTAQDLIDRFQRQAPVALLIRGLLDFAFDPLFLNSIAAQKQHTTFTRRIEFVHLVALLTDVVFRVHPSVRTAYRNNDRLQAVATLKSFYEKLNHTEPAVAAAYLGAVAARVRPLVGTASATEPLAKLRLRILDGNHLAASQRRLDGLEDVPAPLPGQALVLLEHASGLFSHVLPCEDAHTNERQLQADVLTWFSARDCVVADSSFCTERFLRGVADRQAFFIVRHHGGVGLHRCRQRRYQGRNASGRLAEYRACYAQTGWPVRVVEVELTQPTRDGQTVIRLLTNLPQRRASSRTVADLYLGRRRIETAFQELEAALRSEVDTLAYPRAALFAFCVAAAVYNLLQVVRARLERQRVQQQVGALSGTLLAQEVRSYLAGLSMVLAEVQGMPTGDWDSAQMAGWLRQQERGLNLRKYVKSVRGEKKPRKVPRQVRKDSHGATARILQQRKSATKAP